MAQIKPFRAVLPTRDKVHLVASRSYITYGKRHLRGKLETNPFSFLHVINPDFFAPIPTRNLQIKYQLVKEKYQAFLGEKVLYRDEKENLYLYRQLKEGRVYSGFIGGASVKDYYDGTIKVHEHTLTKREVMFKNYLKTTGFNAEPVLMTHPSHTELGSIKDRYYSQRPEYDFTTTNAVRHQFWKIETETDIEQIAEIFASFKALYIADGHHRSASSSLLAKEANDLENPNNPLNYFMSMFIDEEELFIMDYNRLVKNIKGFNLNQFLEGVAQHFTLSKKEPGYVPNCCHEIGMFTNGTWYALTPKPELLSTNDPVEKLDAQLLNTYILEPLLGIKNIKTDKRVAFVGGIEGKQALEIPVNKGKAQVAFRLFPVLIEEIKAVADAQKVMPPKSTWVEPKLRSGLTIYEL